MVETTKRYFYKNEKEGKIFFLMKQEIQKAGG